MRIRPHNIHFSFLDNCDSSIGNGVTVTGHLVLVLSLFALSQLGCSKQPVHLHRPAHPFRLHLCRRHPASRQATRALDALCDLLPAPPRDVLSDNGSEFPGHFQQRMEERGITHWWTYPRSPKMKGMIRNR